MNKVFKLVILAQISLLAGPAMGQQFNFSEQENKQALKNIRELIQSVGNGFSGFRTMVKVNNSQNDSTVQSRMTIFPAKTKSTAVINYRKQLIFFREETEADIYSITQALRPLLRTEEFVEIVPMQQGTYTFTSRAFSSKESVIDIAYKIEKGRKYSTITIIKAEYYASKNPGRVISNNWEPEKKGLGFIYRANGKDSVAVMDVLAKSPAQLAGILKGDLILAIENEPVSTKTTEQVGYLISMAPEKLTLSILRNGKTVKAILQKDWKYKFDKTCLSGDCVNGKGVAMSNAVNGLLMEGQFSEGQLVDGKWYANAKSLQDKGVLIRTGKISMDRYFTGSSLDASKPDGGWWYMVTDHDLVKNSVINEKTLYGYVQCFLNKNQKMIWEGELTAGKKTGDFAEYLYDKGFFWTYYVDGNEKYFHKLRRLSGDQLLGGWLNDDALKYNEVTKTWSGMFNTKAINSKLDMYATLEDIGSFEDIERKALAKITVPASGNSGKTGTITVNPKDKTVSVKYCSRCDGYGVIYTKFCNDCNNTGWGKYVVVESYGQHVRQICGCVGAGMRGYSYIKSTLDSRRQVCGYCNGKGVLK